MFFFWKTEERVFLWELGNAKGLSEKCKSAKGISLGNGKCKWFFGKCKWNFQLQILDSIVSFEDSNHKINFF
ncbi:unnamed protein product [Rhizophagus irregularis]|nr:unnamed protein product [Rhizophagus irregularis]